MTRFSSAHLIGIVLPALLSARAIANTPHQVSPDECPIPDCFPKGNSWCPDPCRPVPWHFGLWFAAVRSRNASSEAVLELVSSDLEPGSQVNAYVAYVSSNGTIYFVSDDDSSTGEIPPALTLSADGQDYEARAVPNTAGAYQEDVTAGGSGRVLGAILPGDRIRIVGQ